MQSTSVVLRHKLIDAIHDTRRRARQIAGPRVRVNDPSTTGSAWQQISQDNRRITVEYWTAHREILQDTETGMPDLAAWLISRRRADAGVVERKMQTARRATAPTCRPGLDPIEAITITWKEDDVL